MPLKLVIQNLLEHVDVAEVDEGGSKAEATTDLLLALRFEEGRSAQKWEAEAEAEARGQAQKGKRWVKWKIKFKIII